jgi:ADP-ribosylglycohydrolase
MLGAIAGDIIGSIYEATPIKSTDFPLFQKYNQFTDDTVMIIAIANAILEKTEYAPSLKSFGMKYPDAGYGGRFLTWIYQEKVMPYNSWGNGAAMRVSPIGFAFKNVEKVLDEAKKSAIISHNHPEGIKGAQSTALAVHMAFTGASKENIRQEISRLFSYDLNRTIDEIRPDYQFDVSCQGSVPEAIIAFLDSTDFKDAIRKAVSLGGDSDTLACIAGGIAQAYYKQVPKEVCEHVYELLPNEFLIILDKFDHTFSANG